MNHLELDAVCVRLAGRRVLDDVTLSLEPGELVGVLGPNGAGKTTLLRAVLGLVAIERGTARFGGRSVRRGRSRIGYVPQRHQFAWDFPVTVEQAALTGRTGRIGWLRQPRVDDWRCVHDALARVGMESLARRPVGELSGGQRQRVLLARALASDPLLLLLDEPTTGLDQPTQDEMHALFTNIAADGVAVLMATHDLASAVSDCTRLLLLRSRLIADGAPSELRDPAPWVETFGVTEHSPLLRTVGATTDTPQTGHRGR